MTDPSNAIEEQKPESGISSGGTTTTAKEATRMAGEKRNANEVLETPPSTTGPSIATATTPADTTSPSVVSPTAAPTVPPPNVTTTSSEGSSPKRIKIDAASRERTTLESAATNATTVGATDGPSTTPVVTTVSTSNATTKAKKEHNAGPPLDLAVTMGFQNGDRIQVQWDIHNDDASTTTHWWGASLLPFDGRTEDNVAIRQLKYDALPEQGFDETSVEDVLFLGQDVLVNMSTDQQSQMPFRRENKEDELVWLTEGDMDTQLNQILMGALQKNQGAWNAMTAAQQARIAEQIKVKKETLLTVLKSHDQVITSDTIKDILSKAFES